MFFLFFCMINYKEKKKTKNFVFTLKIIFQHFELFFSDINALGHWTPGSPTMRWSLYRNRYTRLSVSLLIYLSIAFTSRHIFSYPLLYLSSVRRDVDGNSSGPIRDSCSVQITYLSEATLYSDARIHWFSSKNRCAVSCSKNVTTQKIDCGRLGVFIFFNRHTDENKCAVIRVVIRAPRGPARP